MHTQQEPAVSVGVPLGLGRRTAWGGDGRPAAGPWAEPQLRGCSDGPAGKARLSASSPVERDLSPRGAEPTALARPGELGRHCRLGRAGPPGVAMPTMGAGESPPASGRRGPSMRGRRHSTVPGAPQWPAPCPGPCQPPEPSLMPVCCSRTPLSFCPKPEGPSGSERGAAHRETPRFSYAPGVLCGTRQDGINPAGGQIGCDRVIDRLVNETHRIVQAAWLGIGRRERAD